MTCDGTLRHKNSLEYHMLVLRAYSFALLSVNDNWSGFLWQGELSLGAACLMLHLVLGHKITPFA